MNHTLDIKAVNKYKHKPSTDDREFKELDFGIMPQKLQEEYMDIYEGIQSEIVSFNRFDENSDLSTTYLGTVNKEITGGELLHNTSKICSFLPKLLEISCLHLIKQD